MDGRIAYEGVTTIQILYKLLICHSSRITTGLNLHHLTIFCCLLGMILHLLLQEADVRFEELYCSITTVTRKDARCWVLLQHLTAAPYDH